MNVTLITNSFLPPIEMSLFKRFPLWSAGSADGDCQYQHYSLHQKIFMIRLGNYSSHCEVVSFPRYYIIDALVRLHGT